MSKLIEHPSALQYYRSVIEAAEANRIVSLARSTPDFVKGFRRGHEDVTVVRQRVLARLNGKDGPRQLNQILTELTLHRSLVAVLSEDALRLAGSSLAGVFGEVPFWASMMLDSRLALASIASTQLPKDFDDLAETTPDPKSLNDLLIELGPFLAHVRSILGSAELTARAALPHRPTAGVISEAQLNSRLVQMPRYLAMKRGRQRDKKSLAALQQELEDQNKEIDSLKSELDRLNEQLRQSGETLENQVNVRVQQQANKLLGSLYERSLDASSHLELSKTPANPAQVIEFAQSALAAQARQDKRYGRRSELNRAHEEAQELRAQIQEASLESIRAVPELKTAAEQLDKLINELNSRLAGQRHASAQLSDGYKRFLEALLRVNTIEGLAEQHHYFEAAEQTNAWSANEAADAREKLSQTAMRLYLDLGGASLDQRDLARLAGGSPLGVLRLALLRADVTRIIVDGHNVLHKLKSSWGQFYEAEGPGKRAREHLVRQLDSLCLSHPALEVDLWFDGPVAEQYSVGERLRVMFSGGQGADRADGCIEADLRFLQGSNRKQSDSRGLLVFVVSADRDVRAESTAQKAIALFPSELETVF